MSKLLTIFLTLCLCSGAWAQGWTMFGEPLTKTLGGASSNGVACGVVPNFGSGWSEDMGSFSNCLNIDLISLPLNGVRVTWSQLTNCPTLEHFDRNLVYSMYWSPDSNTWTLINSQTNNTRASDWMTNDVPAPYRTNGYYTVTVRESDWTGGGAPAIADWYYVTNCIGCSVTQSNLSDGSENSIPGWRVLTNLNVPVTVYEYDPSGVSTNNKGAYEGAYSVNSWGATTATQVYTNYVLPGGVCHLLNYTSNPMELHSAWYNPCYLGIYSYQASYRFHEDAHIFLQLLEAQSINQFGGVLSGMIDYGNTWDTMGRDTGKFRLNSFYREFIGWLGAYGVRPLIYAKQSGTYTIGDLDSTNSMPKAVKILRENVKVYSYSGTLAYLTNTFYYLELNTAAAARGVMAIIGTPMPYVNPSLRPQYNWAPYSYWVRNYGTSSAGIMHTGEGFSDTYIETVIRQTGPAPSPWTTNTVRYPFVVNVVSTDGTNSATIQVTLTH